MSLNKVMLIGNLGKDPEVRYTASGDAVVNLTLATSESWKDKNTGEKKEKTEWHRVVFWGKQAEIIAQYTSKGSQLYVEGQLETRKWTDQAGIDKYTTEIKGRNFSFLSKKSDGGNQGQPNQNASHTQQQNTQQNNFDADIPF